MLANMIGVTHVAIAGVSNTPEMVLEDSESLLLATAAVPVLDQFDFNPDPRFTAIFGLVVACGQVYGPRYMLVRKRKANERERKRGDAARPVSGSHRDANSSATEAPQPFEPDLTFGRDAYMKDE